MPDHLPRVADGGDLRRRIVPHALRISALAAEHGIPPEPVTIHQAGSGYEIVIIVRKAPCRGGIDDDRLTPCMRDCETILLDAVRVITGREVADELESRGLLWAFVTVSNSLTKLVKLGRASSSRRAPRGYLHASKVEPKTVQQQLFA